MSNVETVPLLWLDAAVKTLDDAKSLYYKYFGNKGGNRNFRNLLEAVLEDAIGDCGCYPDAIGDCGSYPDAINKISTHREVSVVGTRKFIENWYMNRPTYDAPAVRGWNMDRCAKEIVILTEKEKAKPTKRPGEKARPTKQEEKKRLGRKRDEAEAKRDHYDEAIVILDEKEKAKPTKRPGEEARPTKQEEKKRVRRERDEAQAKRDYYEALREANQEKLDKLGDEIEDELEAVYRELEEVRQRLSEQDKEVIETVQAKASEVITVEKKRYIRETGNIPPHGFISRRDFARVLRMLNLLDEEDDQHVFHIIANSNGGPDHIDNFLWTLGASFNISIGDRHDEFNCFLAGKAKARKAVRVCQLVESEEWRRENEELLRFCEGRAGKKFRFYSEGRHKRKTGGDLFNKGQSVYGKAIRQAVR